MRRASRNPFTRVKNETQRNQVERTSGVQISRLGPAGEESQFAAATVDAFGNLKECAMFDVSGFDESYFCD
jgi:hypothetical protein